MAPTKSGDDPRSPKHAPTSQSVNGAERKRGDAAVPETETERLRRATTPMSMSADLVSAFAGDRPMSGTEQDVILWQKKTRDGLFYSDLLYSVSHHYFAPDLAEQIWEAIVSHKYVISEKLGRDVRITVATLDYLANVKSELSTPTLISEAYVSELANLAMRDGMTGLFNHTTCNELLELELRSHRRYGLGVCLLLLDIDEFKAINEREGHQGGDRVLVEVAKALEQDARDSDVCFRLGGDEFAALLRQTDDPKLACDIAERIRQSVGQVTAGGYPVGASVGVATCDLRTTSAHALISKADRALYEAKGMGKNCICLAKS